MSHFKARNSNYPSFDRLSSQWLQDGGYEQFQRSGEFELVCLDCEQARLHFEFDCRWLFLTPTSPFVSHSRATSHNELPRRLLSGGPNDFFSVK